MTDKELEDWEKEVEITKVNNNELLDGFKKHLSSP